MNLAGARNTTDIVTLTPTLPLVPVPLRLPSKQSLRRKQLLELVGFQCTELVAFADDVSAVRVGGWVEVVQEAEHFSGVAAAAEHDEETRGRSAFSAVGFGGVG